MKKKRDLDTTFALGKVYSVLSFLRTFLICFVAACLLLTFVVRREVVKGGSMEPTLHDGQSVFINVFASYTQKIERFDVVVAKNYETDSLWVKRVIGLPNETVAYKNDCLYINGKKVEESFLDTDYVEQRKKTGESRLFTEDMEARKLGDDEYLLVGDNRMDSLDSRFESVGAFKREQIIANGMLVVSPFEDIRWVGK